MAINHFALIQQTSPHLNKSLEHSTVQNSEVAGWTFPGVLLQVVTPWVSVALQTLPQFCSPLLASPWAASPAWLGQNSNESTVFKDPFSPLLLLIFLLLLLPK